VKIMSAFVAGMILIVVFAIGLGVLLFRWLVKPGHPKQDQRSDGTS
jgi:hypothetical protein